MERKRDIVSLLTIFNLKTRKIPFLPENTSTRIMLVYDKRKNVKKFRVLASSMTEDMDSRIRSWLEENINVDDMICGLRSSDINADDFKNCIVS